MTSKLFDDLVSICDCILDESSASESLRNALDSLAEICGSISGIYPDRSFDAWADDSLLSSGVAINPQAAAHCVLDYQRSVTFIRGIYSAINKLLSRFPGQTLDILYAGCGPFATLLLPLLTKFEPGTLKLNLLDIHQRSLDSVKLLLERFALDSHLLRTIQADACHYQHDSKLHLVIAETMQKSLEQEPQFAVTENFAQQLLPGGLFLPQNIEVELSLANLSDEKDFISRSQHLPAELLEKRYPLATVLSLSAESVSSYRQKGEYDRQSQSLELNPLTVEIPALADIASLDAVLFTRIRVFEQHCLEDYQSEITLPLKCHELSCLVAGQQYKVAYQLGTYPKFNFTPLSTQ